MLKIGSSILRTNVLIAPMAGCTDISLRLIARENGARFAFFEMVDSNSIIYGNSKKTFSMLKSTPEDNPIAAQILGDDPVGMLKAAKRILELSQPVFVDINAACPVKKAVRQKAGAYLVKHPEKLYEMIRTLASALPVPVTVKLRSGYAERDTKAISAIARNCESSGASAIFIHGRTREQGYAGEIDYESIRVVKDSVKIPVFGSGNIFTPESAKLMIDQTACDGVLVARGGLGNPWLARDIEEFISCGHRQKTIAAGTRIDTLKRHLNYIDRYRDSSPSGKVGFMRKTALWYIRHFTRSARLREKISLVKSYEKMIELLDDLRSEKDIFCENWKA
ncbi:MAG: tRNA dihydrouridine synthase DusB [Candidatus Omnitrophica bacterium]|nr:tRNA dihydrouridine synthase DusB [Candidatus Omnitrophota bacterium]